MKKITRIYICTCFVLVSFIAISSPRQKPSEYMGKICYNGSQITGSISDCCTDCDDCNCYLGRICLGVKGYC